MFGILVLFDTFVPTDRQHILKVNLGYLCALGEGQLYTANVLAGRNLRNKDSQLPLSQRSDIQEEQ